MKRHRLVFIKGDDQIKIYRCLDCKGELRQYPGFLHDSTKMQTNGFYESIVRLFRIKSPCSAPEQLKLFV